MENNKKIVEKAKKTLANLGYEVKTTHLYEFFSQMSNYNSYSVAKAKETDFKNVLSSFENKETTSIISQIVEKIQNEKNKDLFFLGFKDKELAEPHFIDLKEKPNILFDEYNRIEFSLLTYMKANSENAQLFVINTLNEDTYSWINKDLYKADSVEKAQRVIDLIYEEFLARKETNNQVKYNKIITLIEQTELLLEDLRFNYDFDKEFTSSHKLVSILRYGRKYGIYFIIDGRENVPKSISLFCQNKVAGLFYNSEEPKLNNISFKSISEKFLFLTKKMIYDVVEKNILKEFYSKKKMTDLVYQIESLEAKQVISALHEKLSHQITEMEAINNLDISHLVQINPDLKIAIMVRAKKDSNIILSKHLNNMIHALKVYECEKGIIYTSSSKVSKDIYRMAKENNIEIVDHDDLIKFAMKIDNEKKESN